MQINTTSECPGWVVGCVRDMLSVTGNDLTVVADSLNQIPYTSPKPVDETTFLFQKYGMSIISDKDKLTIYYSDKDPESDFLLKISRWEDESELDEPA